jgi:uncharacterized protein (TIGR02594 family)
MSYRNPKAAPINTGAAVYKGIQKLSSDVVTFANNERARKAALIAQGLVFSQEIDDNVNKMGSNIGEGGQSSFQTQIIKEGRGVKDQMSKQFDVLGRTFSSPEDRAKAKAEITRLQKYPKQLVQEMATGKYIVEQLSTGMQLKAGTAGSVSFSNDINLVGVGMDLKNGGKNTTIENKNGGRVLVTKNDEGEDFRLNISAITQSLADNPDQALFKTVVDTQADIDMYTAQLGLSKGVDKETLIKNKYLTAEAPIMIAGVKTIPYSVNKDVIKTAVSKLSTDLLTKPENYVYANSLWQDHMGNSTTLRQSLGLKKENLDAVTSEIQDHYIKKALEQAQLNIGFTLTDTPLAADKVTKLTAGEIKQNDYKVKVAEFQEDAKKGGFFDNLTGLINKLTGPNVPWLANYNDDTKNQEIREMLSGRGLSILPIYSGDGTLIPGVLNLADGPNKQSTEISSKNLTKKELTNAILVMQGVKPADIKKIVEGSNVDASKQTIKTFADNWRKENPGATAVEITKAYEESIKKKVVKEEGVINESELDFEDQSGAKIPNAPNRNGVRINYDNQGNIVGESSHIMKTETDGKGNWFSFPTLFQDKDGTWVDMSKEAEIDWKPVYEEAKKRGEIIDFGKDKESALAYGKGSWKKKTSINEVIETPAEVIETPVEVIEETTKKINDPATTKVEEKELIGKIDNIISSSPDPKKVVADIGKTDPAVAKNPLNFANKYLGIDENDPKQQKVIKGFLTSAVPKFIKNDEDVTKDTSAWCAAFVNSILKAGKFNTLDDKGDNFNLVRAKEYERIGTKVDSIVEAKEGDILVTRKRLKNNKGQYYYQYHTGFYAGKKNGKYTMLGGNQNDKVSVWPITKEEIYATRRIEGVEEMSESSRNKILNTEFYDKREETKLI